MFLQAVLVEAEVFARLLLFLPAVAANSRCKLVCRRSSSGMARRSSGRKPSTNSPSIPAGISTPKSSPVILPGQCWFILLDASFPSPAWLLTSATISSSCFSLCSLLVPDCGSMWVLIVCLHLCWSRPHRCFALHDQYVRGLKLN